MTCIFDTTQKFCQGYICTESADFSVQITQNDLEYERKRSEQQDIKNNSTIRCFSVEYLETLALYRKICDKLPDYNTFLFHGSVVSVDGEGYLFTAKSGVGKSTHTALWRQYFKDRAVMINDDKPLIKITQNGAMVFGTPWNGKHKLGTNTSVPLKAISIVNRATENYIHRAKDPFPMLLSQTYRPSNPSMLLKTLQLLEHLNVPICQLYCTISEEAVRVAYKEMKQ